jgi:(1->4)-alpha-D-glucan 1-alpha-D-glucosylmutase
MNKEAQEQPPGAAEKVREAFERVRRNPPLRIPVSTYRLQFNRSFRLPDARAVVPYLEALGISDIYASPYFRAQEGSMHGYDIVDHNSLNPEVGTEEDYEELAAALKGLGMGQILDIVPNHMGIGSSGNRWWLDILENGPSSPYSSYFDIDWDPLKEELENKVLIPILGDQYGRVLEGQELRLSFEAGAFFINYFKHRLPVEPATYTQILQHRTEALEAALGGEDPRFQEFLSIITALKHLPPCTEKDPEKVTERRREKEIIKKRLQDLYEESPEFRAFLDENIGIFNGTKHVQGSFDPLDALLSSQVYRLSYWQVATEEINYRRFFDINELAAIRMENPSVFGEVHRLVFRLIREGKVTGLRVDHPDGLHNPKEYFRMLQEECFIQTCLGPLGAEEGDRAEGQLRELYRSELAKDPGLGRPFYIVGEKILIDGETLPEDWQIFGTTGYVFMNSVNGLLVDSANARAVSNIYSRYTRSGLSFQRLVREKKELIMRTSMSSEMNVLGHELDRISEKDRRYRDFTLNDLTDAIVELIAFFPVYRTYITEAGPSEKDRFYVNTAIARARRYSRELSPSIFEFLRSVLLLQYPDKFDEERRRQWLCFTMKFQQLTGPVMAKGLEDTVFYVYNRLVSLNAVGGNPDRFGISVETFHSHNSERLGRWPHTLITTSTHDSKRSEDVRARINVISELPGEWKDCLTRWSRTNKKRKAVLEGQLVPDRNEEYLLYQTLLGAWPMGPAGGEGDEGLRQRIKQYMLKAAREAKVNTSWINQNPDYENALLGFVDGIMGNSHFLEDFREFQKKVSHYGAFNSLSQTLLKITSPGVPDFYQGTELWNLSLVDPDNRRPVDYSVLTAALSGLNALEAAIGQEDLTRELLLNWEDGRIKLYLTYKALNFRRDKKELFLAGQYAPLSAGGIYGEHLVAFARARGDERAVTVVPRLLAGLLKSDELPIADVWGDASIPLPFEKPGSTYRDIFSGRAVKVAERDGGAALLIQDVLHSFPVSLLERTAG